MLSAVNTDTNAPPRRSGKRAPAITYGYSKDHRPDLKQLLFILTTDADGGVPVQFRTADGNTNDSITHIETWTSAARPWPGGPISSTSPIPSSAATIT